MAAAWPPLPSTVALRSYRRRYPEWWLIALAGACWLLLVVRHGPGAELHQIQPATPAADIAAPHLHTPAVPDRDQRGVPPLVVDPPQFLFDWAVMSVAMMAPVSLAAFRHVAFNSFRYRQRRSVAIFLLACLAVWVAYGAAAGLVSGTLLRLPLAGASAYLWPALLLLAAGWQLTPWKRRALHACRLTVPLRPFGLAADLACARFGQLHGWRCVRSCWALMLPMALFGHGSLAALAGITAIVVVEETVRSHRRFVAESAAILAASALVLLAV